MKKDTQTHGGLAKGIPRNRLATPSKVPRKVASSKRAVGVLTGGEREVQVATKEIKSQTNERAISKCQSWGQKWMGRTSSMVPFYAWYTVLPRWAEKICPTAGLGCLFDKIWKVGTNACLTTRHGNRCGLCLFEGRFDNSGSLCYDPVRYMSTTGGSPATMFGKVFSGWDKRFYEVASGIPSSLVRSPRRYVAPSVRGVLDNKR